MPNTRTPSISSEVPIGRRINGSEMLMGAYLALSFMFKLRGSAGRDRELPNRLIDTTTLSSTSAPAVVCFLPEGEVAFDPIEDVDDGIARMRCHTGKSFLANCAIDQARNIVDEKPKGANDAGLHRRLLRFRRCHGRRDVIRRHDDSPRGPAAGHP